MCAHAQGPQRLPEVGGLQPWRKVSPFRQRWSHHQGVECKHRGVFANPERSQITFGKWPTVQMASALPLAVGMKASKSGTQLLGSVWKPSRATPMWLILLHTAQMASTLLLVVTTSPFGCGTQMPKLTPFQVRASRPRSFPRRRQGGNLLKLWFEVYNLSFGLCCNLGLLHGLPWCMTYLHHEKSREFSCTFAARWSFEHRHRLVVHAWKICFFL